MSYDLEIGTYRQPTREQVEAWVAAQELTLEADDGGFMVSRIAKRGDGHLFRLDGPVAAEADDFAEDLAAACLAPCWMVTVNVPYSSPKLAIALARSLARQLAEANEGAAFDPQEGKLIWPRGRPKRVEPRRRQETTSVVELEWLVAADRWDQAPGTLLQLIRRRCPQALPKRYGTVEPPEHRFDPDDPDAFVRFVLEEDSGFWFAGRPSFGGFWDPPGGGWKIAPKDEPLRMARLKVTFDGRVLEQDVRWRETVIDLFTSAASRLGAFFAAAQVEPHWTVSANNRLWATAKTMKHSSESFGLGGLWQGLPPIPVWLGWFGAPYRDLVAPHLTTQALGQLREPEPSALRRLLFGRRADVSIDSTPTVETRPDGIFIRLGDEPRVVDRLAGWPLPANLTYSRHPPPRLPEDAAELIPPLIHGG